MKEENRKVQVKMSCGFNVDCVLDQQIKRFRD